MCDCPYCEYTGSGNRVPLPVHLAVTLGERTYQAWAWLLDAKAKRVWLGTHMDAERVLWYKPLVGDRRVARAVLKEYGVHPGNAVPLVSWTVRTRGIQAPLRSSEVAGNVAYVHAAVRHCACTAACTEASAARPPPPPPKRQAAFLELKERPKKPKNAATFALHPPHDDNSSSDDGEYGDGYDATALGGDAEAVAELLGKRRVWNQEMVDELLRVGARPPLEAHRVVDNGRFRSAQCTVTEPCGRRLADVWLPMALLRHKYPREIAHLC